MKNDTIRTKIIILLISVMLVVVEVELFMLDASLGWGAIKLISCVIVGLWIVFLVPALRYFYLEHKDEDMEFFADAGVRFGINGLFGPLFMTPYYGMKYYLNR